MELKNGWSRADGLLDVFKEQSRISACDLGEKNKILATSFIIMAIRLGD